jgi:hypothetical protein
MEHRADQHREVSRVLIPNEQAQYKIALSHVKQSPYASQVEAATIGWMRELNLLRTDEHLRRVNKMEISKYAGYAYPFGDYDDTLLFAKYITLWLLWDDLVVEKGSDLRATVTGISDVFMCATSEQRDDDNYLRAWRSIVSDYRLRGASQAFLERLGRNMLTWLRTAAAEKASVFQSRYDSLQTYINRRVITIGMIPTAQLLELNASTEIPQSQLVWDLVIESSRIVAFSNELASVEKDIDWVNLVSIYRKINRCSIDKAYRAIIDMHDMSVRRMARLLEHTTGETRKWAELLQYCAEGFSYWQTVCTRYGRSRISCDCTPEAVAAGALSKLN